MKAVITACNLYDRDAIGNCVLGELSSFRAHGIEAFLYAETCAKRFAPFMMTREDFLKAISDSNNLLLYHHSGFWQDIEGVVQAAKARVVIRYHSITPSEFYTPYCEAVALLSKLGRLQTKRLARSPKVERFIADSCHNMRELQSWGAPEAHIAVVPPFNMLEDVKAAGNGVDRDGAKGPKTVLFVGRVAPNKGHRHLVETVRAYRDRFGGDVRLCIVGRIDPQLHAYYVELRRFIRACGLSGTVVFTRDVDAVGLRGYYRSSDIFLVMSEHEGFCVPVIEAQHYGVPVIALDRCAVGDTAGAEQLTIRDVDYGLFAAAIDLVLSKKDRRDYLIAKGYENCRKYAHERVSRQFMEAIA